MRNILKGNVHSIETCGTVDGPGIRYVIFLQGCPLRCQYCHNPDTWEFNSSESFEMSVEDLMEDILKYQPFMKFSGGGITISGGEPLLQADFVREVFKACREKGIKTALDTSGFSSLENAKKVLEFTDLVLLDIKSYNEKTYQKITSRNLQPTLEFAELLKEKNIPTWIRFVLVPNLSDNKKEILELSKYISTLNNVELVEILPFHKMGEYKWTELDLDYQLKNTPEPNDLELEKVKNIFKSHNKNVK